MDRELKSLAKLQIELKTLSAGISNLEGSLGQKIDQAAESAEQSRKDLELLQKSLGELADKKVDLDTFELELLKLRKNYQNRVVQEISAINKNLDAIEKRIDNLQRISKSSKKSMKSLSKKPSATAGPQKTTAPSKSGSISEQDLLE